MKKIPASLALALCLALLPAGAARADLATSPYTVCPPERFGITMLPVPGADEKVFRFDRVCGTIDALGADHTGKTEWQAMELPGLPGCLNDARVHYQLFATPQKDHVFIINTDVKLTWELDPAKMTWRQM